MLRLCQKINYSQASKMAQCVKVPDKSEHLSYSPKTHLTEERTDSCKLSLELCMCSVMFSPFKNINVNK